MSLVSYDYGSDSEHDSEKEENFNQEAFTSNNLIENKRNNEEVVADTSNLFSKLPNTKSKIEQEVAEDQIEDFIPKSKPVKERQKVRITIPSLSQFKGDEDEEEPDKKFKPSAKGCGLISILPPVKGSVKTSTTFVPKVLTKPVIKKPIPQKKPTVNLIKKRTISSLSDTESGDELELPETFDDEMWQKVCGRQKKKVRIEKRENKFLLEKVEIAPEPEKPYEGLDNEAFKELVGKTKKPIGNIKLIDINEEEIVPDKEVWMTKSLTDPEMAPKPVEDDPVDPTRRRKHHITFLAQKAKANEQELANAWASSKNNRLMSRAKYGF